MIFANIFCACTAFQRGVIVFTPTTLHATSSCFFFLHPTRVSFSLVRLIPILLSLENLEHASKLYFLSSAVDSVSFCHLSDLSLNSTPNSSKILSCTCVENLYSTNYTGLGHLCQLSSVTRKTASWATVWIF